MALETKTVKCSKCGQDMNIVLCHVQYEKPMCLECRLQSSQTPVDLDVNRTDCRIEGDELCQTEMAQEVEQEKLDFEEKPVKKLD